MSLIINSKINFSFLYNYHSQICTNMSIALYNTGAKFYASILININTYINMYIGKCRCNVNIRWNPRLLRFLMMSSRLLRNSPCTLLTTTFPDNLHHGYEVCSVFAKQSYSSRFYLQEIFYISSGIRIGTDKNTRV